MTEKKECVEWIGHKCVKWEVGEDDKIHAIVNKRTCPTNIYKKFQEDVGRQFIIGVIDQKEEKEEAPKKNTKKKE